METRNFSKFAVLDIIEKSVGDFKYTLQARRPANVSEQEKLYKEEWGETESRKTRIERFFQATGNIQKLLFLLIRNKRISV